MIIALGVYLIVILLLLLLAIAATVLLAALLGRRRHPRPWYRTAGRRIILVVAIPMLLFAELFWKTWKEPEVALGVFAVLYLAVLVFTFCASSVEAAEERTKRVREAKEAEVETGP